jgi:hypothetical protein
MPRFCELYSGICFTTEEKHGHLIYFRSDGHESSHTEWSSDPPTQSAVVLGPRASDEQVTHYNSYCVILMHISYNYTTLQYVLLRQPPNTKTNFHNSTIILTQNRLLYAKDLRDYLIFTSFNMA